MLPCKSSSSNILGQPGSGGGAFDDRQLGNGDIVETTTTTTTRDDIRTTATTDENRLVASQLQQQGANTRTATSGSALAFNLDHLIPKTTTTTTCYSSQGLFATSYSNSPTRITATPVRQPMRLINPNVVDIVDDDDEEEEDDDSANNSTADRRPPQVNSSCRSRLSRGRLLSSSNHDLRVPLTTRHTDLVSGSDMTKPTSTTTITTTAAKSLTSTPTLNKKLLNTKSISLSAFNVKSSLLPLTSSSTTATTTTTTSSCSSSAQNARGDLRMVNLNEHDEPEARKLKRLQQMYGDNERVLAAAIIIQRAFREYRICKRFRAITEQLRRTCQSSASLVKHDDDQKRLPYSNLHESDPDGDLRSSSRQSTRSVSDRTPSADLFPFASGATRAATCESLSQAANHLAASAAAARAAGKKQTTMPVPITNGVAKSASCQQVATFATANGLKTSNSTTRSDIASINSERSRAQLKSSDSVVAAAINFQQLESIRKRQYRVGLNVFNHSPAKGLSFLIAHSFIDCSPPYAKSSTSYYLSNQLHFIDKQRFTAQQQSIHPSKTTTTTSPTTHSAIAPTTNPITPLTNGSLSPATTKDNLQQQNCRLCLEEVNLKRNIAHFLLHRKGLAKEKIGEYLGNLQSQFVQDVLVYYLQELDFNGLQIDVALRKFSSTLRMPGEAQKIERFVDRFACRYVECQQTRPTTQLSPNYISSNNDPTQIAGDVTAGGGARLFPGHDQTSVCYNSGKNNLTMLSKDEIFILTFAIIMLNTDLHSPSLKSTTRMSANQFVNNLRGVFKSQTINESDLIEIYERVKANQITTSPDHVTHVMKVQQGLTTNNFQKKEIPNLCVPHRRLVCFCRLFEVYDVTKKERLGQHQREIFLFNDILLVTKLARRARANAPQQYTYRQSIPLQGLYVQLSQSAHYSFGIVLRRRSNNETVIMFNARNELDQGRFVDDLNESIAEMDEMEHIRAHNIVESIHLKQLDRLRRHTLMHEPPSPSSPDCTTDNTTGKTMQQASSDEKVIIMEDNEVDHQDNTSNYSSFNSSSAAGSLKALCTNPAKMKCTNNMAAPAPMVVEPVDEYAT